jgi:predicted DNA-binding transcriptional regulator AlpA
MPYLDFYAENVSLVDENENSENQEPPITFASDNQSKAVLPCKPEPNSDYSEIWAIVNKLREEAQHIRISQSKRPKTNSPVRGLKRNDAADYIGVSTTKFDELVKSNQMPSPIRIGGRVVWDIHELDESFDALKEVNQDKARFDEDELLAGW